MPDRRCTACGLALEGNVSPSGHCLSCGHDLTLQALGAGIIPLGVNLREVAKRQRILLQVTLAYMLAQFGPVFAPLLVRQLPRGLSGVVGICFMLMFFAAWIAILVCSSRLQEAMGMGVGLRIITILFLFAPCANLLVLLAVNARANGMLRTAGLKIGLLGVSDEDVVRQTSSNQCKRCGYLLIGNTSGICPECGLPTASATVMARPSSI